MHFVALALLLAAQDEPAPAERPREPLEIVTPLRPRGTAGAPWSADAVDEDALARWMPRTIPDALVEVRGVSLQRTAWGLNGVALRGLGAPRTLLVHDGVRLNNAVTRDDPDFVWGTLDPFLAGSLEVVRGPAGIAHGGDAVAGTVLVRTPDIDDFPDGFQVRPRVRYRYGSAEDSNIVRGEATAASSGAAITVGGTYRNFDELAGGRDVGPLPGTAYDGTDVDGKVAVDLGGGALLTLGAHGARQFDVPRTHRTIESKSWHGTSAGADLENETDFERDLLYLQLRWKVDGLVDDLAAGVSYHRHDEGHNRVDAADTRSERETEVRSAGFFVHAARDTSVGFVSFGAEFYADVVNSNGSDRTGAGLSTTFDRGEVADDSVFDFAGVYLQDEIALGQSFDVIVGARLTWARINAEDVDASAMGGPAVESFEETWSGFAGHVRAVYRLTQELSFWAAASQSFRPPNLDETTAVREVGSGQLDLPNAELEPERALVLELGARAHYEQFSAGVSGFQTSFRDFIARRPAPGFGPDAFVRDNFDDAYVRGVEAYFEYRLATTWVFWADFAWQIGNADSVTSDGSIGERPITRMPPAAGHVGVRYQPKGHTYFIEGVIRGVSDQRRLSAFDEVDTERIPPGGTPGYMIVSLRAGMELLTNIRGTVAVENVSSQDVRTHGSGVNEPGTNFVVTVDIRF